MKILVSCMCTWWCIHRQCWMSSGAVSLGKKWSCVHMYFAKLHDVVVSIYWLRCFCFIEWQTCWCLSIYCKFRFGHATSSMVFCNMDGCVPLVLSLHAAMSWGLCKICITCTIQNMKGMHLWWFCFALSCFSSNKWKFSYMLYEIRRDKDLLNLLEKGQA